MSKIILPLKTTLNGHPFIHKNTPSKGDMEHNPKMSLTGCQCFRLSGGHFVDAALLVDEAALDHFEVQVTRHLCDQQHTDQLT